MKLERIIHAYTTLGSLGYITASGTIASLLSLPFIVMIYTYVSQPMYTIGLILFALSAVYAVKKTLKDLKWSGDPSEIVIDEVLGMAITFYGIQTTNSTLLLGFILFRILDITKILGIKYCEQIGGAWGIMLDDIVAGVMSNIIIRWVV